MSAAEPERPVALVTGAARGIGAATVLRLAATGWRVVATDRCEDDERLPYPLGTKEELDAVADAAGAAGGTVLAMPADATRDGDVRSAVDAARGAFGGLDAIVAAAGVIAGGVPLWQMDQDPVAAVVEHNLLGALTTVRVGLPAVLDRPEPRRGRVVVVASTAAVRGLPLLAAYCAAKAGVTGLVRALAVELRGTGVTANAVSPGSTDTPLLAESARLYGLDGPGSFAAQQPIERLIDPSEIAAAVAFLLSDEAAAVTGTTVTVDGGLAL
jgi:SDR family mycofactocin-dependent oxidoreductase